MATDLHIHTIYSDGTLTPAQAVEEGLHLGLKAIAIADHDTVDGTVEALAAAEGLPLEVLPAVEINVEEQGQEIHILGYFFELNYAQLAQTMEPLRQSRLDRVRRFVAKLSEAGVRLTLEEVLERAGPGTVGRPHIAQALAAAGYALDDRDAFRRYLSPGAATYVPRQHISPSEAIDVIRSRAGVPVLAHPAKIKIPALRQKMLELGVMGIEVYHPEHNPAQEASLRAYAEEHGLLISGGSDYHGRSSIRDFFLGQKTCPDEDYLRLKAATQDALSRVSG